MYEGTESASLPLYPPHPILYVKENDRMANRLHLDFSISSTSDRKDFVDQYVQRPEFIRAPLTEDELETIANYILWGKDPDGLNVTQRGEI